MEAEVNMFGRYKLTEAIRKSDPQASGSIEVRADSEYCEVEIRACGRCSAGSARSHIALTPFIR